MPGEKFLRWIIFVLQQTAQEYTGLIVVLNHLKNKSFYFKFYFSPNTVYSNSYFGVYFILYTYKAFYTLIDLIK